MMTELLLRSAVLQEVCQHSHCDITVSTDAQEGLESEPGSVPADL